MAIKIDIKREVDSIGNIHLAVVIDIVAVHAGGWNSLAIGQLEDQLQVTIVNISIPICISCKGHGEACLISSRFPGQLVYVGIAKVHLECVQGASFDDIGAPGVQLKGGLVMGGCSDDDVVEAIAGDVIPASQSPTRLVVGLLSLELDADFCGACAQ